MLPVPRELNVRADLGQKSMNALCIYTCPSAPFLLFCFFFFFTSSGSYTLLPAFQFEKYSSICLNECRACASLLPLLPPTLISVHCVALPFIAWAESDLFTPKSLLGVTWREHGAKARHRARTNRQDRPGPSVCASYRRFECMVPEIAGLSLPHARHDR